MFILNIFNEMIIAAARFFEAIFIAGDFFRWLVGLFN